MSSTLADLLPYAAVAVQLYIFLSIDSLEIKFALVIVLGYQVLYTNMPRLVELNKILTAFFQLFSSLN